MISNIARFLLYPELNAGPPITTSLSDQVESLELQVEARFVPKKTTTYSHPVKMRIQDPPLNITTTIVQVPATITPMTYKSAVQNQLATTTQSKSNQIQPAAARTPQQQQQQHQHQQPQSDTDSDKMETGSTKSDILENSASPIIHTLATVISAMTEVVAEMKSVLKATDDNRKNREEKAKQSRIQRGKVEYKDRVDKRKVDKKEREEEEIRREEIRKADKKVAATIQRKDKKEAKDRSDASNKAQTKYRCNHVSTNGFHSN